jgi:hypothetical protein
MKISHIFILLITTTLFCCNNDNRKKTIERTIYKTKHDELVILSVTTDSTYHVDWLLAGTKEKHKTPNATNSSGKLNYFGLIQYEGKTLNDGNKLILLEKIIKNSIKMNPIKELKAPLDTNTNMIYYKDSKSLEFNNELLIKKTNLSIERALEIVDKHEHWDGKEINLDIVFKN